MDMQQTETTKMNLFLLLRLLAGAAVPATFGACHIAAGGCA